MILFCCKEVIATESIGNRIKNLRKALGLTQKDFGSRIGVKPNTIATYEIDRNAPIDAVLSLICREFGVNEVWLRTGVGEMFRPISREEEIAAFVGDVLHDEPGSFRKGLVSALAALTTEDWKVLEKLSIEAIERARKSSEEDAGINAKKSEQKGEGEKRLIPLPPSIQDILPNVKGLDDDDEPKTVLKEFAAKGEGKILWALSPKQAAQLEGYLEARKHESAAEKL